MGKDGYDPQVYGDDVDAKARMCKKKNGANLVVPSASWRPAASPASPPVAALMPTINLNDTNNSNNKQWELYAVWIPDMLPIPHSGEDARPLSEVLREIEDQVARVEQDHDEHEDDSDSDSNDEKKVRGVMRRYEWVGRESCRFIVFDCVGDDHLLVMYAQCAF